MRPRSSATSTAPKPNASPSRRPTRAGSPNWRPDRAPDRRWPRRSAATRRSRICSAGWSPMPASSIPATPPTRSRAKFYGDVQERITAISLHLLFFALELNRIDDALLEQAMADPALGHYRPWIEDMRKEKPYQLEDRIEQLFHEKSVSALRRLEPPVRRDHRRPAIQGRRQELAIEPTLNLLQDPTRRSARPRPKRSPRPSRTTSALFSLITNTLAKDKEISDRWRGFADVADARHLSNRVEREVVDALVVVGARRLSAALASLLRAEGADGSARTGCRTGTATRRCRKCRCARSPGRKRATRCSPPMARSRPRWRRSPNASSTSAGSTRRCGRARRQARSRIRPCRRRILMCCSIIRASRAT